MVKTTAYKDKEGKLHNTEIEALKADFAISLAAAKGSREMILSGTNSNNPSCFMAGTDPTERYFAYTLMQKAMIVKNIENKGLDTVIAEIKEEYKNLKLIGKEYLIKVPGNPYC
jgi:hypothetical protein